MKFITFSGPPSSGKTAVIIKMANELQRQNLNVAVAKFDCLYTDDDLLYSKANIQVKKALSGAICPDHFFVSNVEEIYHWGLSINADLLISESAGLCNRCAPYINEFKAICVIDNLSGINTPKKIGPMLQSADIIIITKGDIVSQAEREVFASRVHAANPQATIIHINGLTGQGAFELTKLLNISEPDGSLENSSLRYPMPAAVCSYCTGETRIGSKYQLGNIKKITP
ncbi:MAG: GTP-binding protein [Lentisphaeria bacterium]